MILLTLIVLIPIAATAATFAIRTGNATHLSIQNQDSKEL